MTPVADRYPQRRERLLERIRGESVDALLVSREVNVTYLTGFTGDSTVLVLTPERALLISDGRYTTQIAEECPDLDVYIRPPSQQLTEAIGEQIGRLAVKSVAFDATHLTIEAFETIRERSPQVDWKPDSRSVEQLRAVKDDWEIEQIVQAIRIAERAGDACRALFRAVETEKETADRLEQFLRLAGARCSSFPPIVAAGPRAALPHAQSSDGRLGDADLILTDWGAKAPHYCSDITRVWLRAGTPHADRYRDVYEAVLRAQQAAIDAIKPGATGGDVDRAARTCLADAGYGEHFTHSIGHGVGLQIHEAPFMRPNADVTLQPGMVVTVEPGVYLPGWAGFRIEDDVLLTDQGIEVLTRTPKDFDSIFVEW